MTHFQLYGLVFVMAFTATAMWIDVKQSIRERKRQRIIRRLTESIEK